MNLRTFCGWSALFFALVLSIGHGQGQPAPAQSKPTLQAGGYTVLVDAVVTDSKNKVVSDLSADDFVILEDGVEQTIDFFQFHESDAVAPVAAETVSSDSPRPATISPPPVESVGNRRNLIIFLLDYATTEFTNQKLVQEACEKYVRENLRPNDYVAVFSLATSFRFLQDFTNNRELLLAALAGRGATGNALAAGPAAPQPVTGDGEVEPITASGSAAAGQAAREQGSGQADLMLAQRIQELYYTMTSYLGKREARAVLSAIQAIAHGVEKIEGRKTLLLFSQGFIVGGDVEPDLQRTVSSANRANVAIYAMDSQGLATRALSDSLIPGGELSSISAATGRDRIRAVGGESLFDRARQVGSDVRDSALRYVSSATGGFAIRNTNDLHLSLERIDADIRSYYLMGYRPSNLNFDGQFRKIEVQAKGKGLTVRARSGYLALPPGMEVLSGDEYRLLREVESGTLDTGLPVYFRIDQFHPGAEGRNVMLTLEVPGQEIQFDEEVENGETKHRADLSILGLARSQDGRVAMRFGSPVFLSAAPPEYQALRAGTVNFSNLVALEPGIYSFEMIVQDKRSNRTGAVNSSLMLRAAESENLSLSSIVLGKDVEASGSPTEGMDFEGARILPSASRRFKPAERLVFFLSVYNSETDKAGSAKVKVEISIAKSGAAAAASLPAYTITKTGEFGEVSTSKYIELRGLQSGAYFLTAAVTDLISGEKAVGRTPFQILEPTP